MMIILFIGRARNIKEVQMMVKDLILGKKKHIIRNKKK
jgi:hypothetical protein